MILRKTVVVLGSTGMLGHQVVKYLEGFSDFIVHDISYRTKLRESTIVIDAMSSISLELAIANINPDFIVNCIGVLVKGSEDIARAIFLNAYLPYQLQAIAKITNSKLIHISTDCVFSGAKGQYVESDFRDGQGTYSQTKILGEIIDDTNLTIRTSIIGPELKSYGEGLFNWFMTQTADRVSGYTASIWSGVTTLELAKAIKWAIESQVVGLYHVTNNNSINKCEILQLFQVYTKKNVYIDPVLGKKVDKSFIDTRLLMDYSVPSYQKMIFEMVRGINQNKSLYSQYKVEFLD